MEELVYRRAEAQDVSNINALIKGNGSDGTLPLKPDMTSLLLRRYGNIGAVNQIMYIYLTKRICSPQHCCN